MERKKKSYICFFLGHRVMIKSFSIDYKVLCKDGSYILQLWCKIRLECGNSKGSPFESEWHNNTLENSKL